MRFFLLAILCSISSLSYCSPKDDSILKLKREVQILRKELLSSDSIIKDNDARLNVKMDADTKALNTRFDDYRAIVGAIITLLLFIIAGSWYNATKTARKAAEDEFDKKFNEYHERIKKMESDARELLAKIESHESLASSMKEHIDDLTKGADGQTKEVIGNILEEYMQKMFK